MKPLHKALGDRGATFGPAIAKWFLRLTHNTSARLCLRGWPGRVRGLLGPSSSPITRR